ncbi:helix-turn-helix domain-containing protein [Pseudomonas akapageensis]|uniref:helix-turn-helix domain-containing protein n=1 Tax=Pseudomonas akapageensis TaxID=2609961 RepID=UPI00140C1EA4|nr:helix-turn-helix transcriptional regulator [Pseudomonas akapageensis]
MSGIGSRIREERERLGLTQRVFGEIGGVEPNAQGKYESGERTPKADYLAAVAARGADVLYILTGVRTPTPLGHLSQVEERVLGCYRVLQQEDQDALHRLVTTLATQSAVIASKIKPSAVAS